MNLSKIDYQNILHFINNSLCNSHNTQSLLSRLFQFNHSLLWHADTQGNMYNLEFFNFNDQFILDYKEVHNANDVMHPKKQLSKLKHNEAMVYRMGEVTTSADLAKSMYYQFIESHEMIDQMVVYFANGSRIYGGMGFARFKGDQPFSQKDKEILQTLSIHLQHLVKNTMVEKEIEAKNLYFKKGRGYELGIIQANQDQRISFYNEIAQNIIKEIDSNVTVEEFYLTSIIPHIPTDLSECKSPYYFYVNKRKVKAIVYETDHTLSRSYTIYLYNQEETLSITRPQEVLSNREWEIYQLVLKGYTNEEIAKALWITINTVKKHLRNMYEKNGVTNRTGLIYKLEGPAN
ncbi:helix-turn-helix domain-containing protein [Sporosarcina obsidiansis]|uniref:helix-turn-helix domain-containing protein n=1 Tax=Sporosarcina obsidiansis TaxID=2660748 RepID=UPI00129A2482|nr:helix-turn-helix transcriptional regulator [Sporosarcina obsidiansis]